MLQLIVPVSDFPTCPEPGCQYRFFGQIYSRSIFYLQKHLRNFHRRTILATEYWCALCNKYMFDSPKSHDCFRHVQMYNVDFRKYEFRHRCEECGFGSNSGVMMRKHSCRRTPIPRDFPSSQDDLTPPHLVFAGHSPQLASQHSSMPVATATSDENIENTQDSFPSVVSLVDEINSPSRVAPSASTSASIALQDAPVDTTLFPPNIAGTCCRIAETNTVHFGFPIRDFLHCTEPGCEATITQTDWSGARSSLFRHLRGVHKLPEPEIARWCSTCNIKVPQKISSHRCFRGSGYFRIPQEVIESQSFEFVCLICKMSFPNATSL